MDKILLIDLAFLVIFCICIVIFLYKNKSNLKREGIIFMYRTKFGMKAIRNFSVRHSKKIKTIKYIVIAVALLLMVLVIFLFAFNAYSYLKSPAEMIEKTNGAPPIAPLIPYFPQVFGLQNFFPNFYFVYFIIALAIVAIVHEFSHGVFMKTFGIKIKSTGFLFLGPILGAFVEEDKNNFKKKKNSEQMAILGAGVFANFIFAILFFIILVIFFKLSYAPAGYQFTGYPETIINSSHIKGFENHSEDLVFVNTSEQSYIISRNFYNLLMENQSLLKNHFFRVYLNAPAIKSGLRGAIIRLDGEKISDKYDFQNKFLEKKPGQKINITTIYLGEEREYLIVLEANPANYSRGLLGIKGRASVSRENILGRVFKLIQYQDPLIFYKSKYNSEFADFFKYLLYWIALINFFVALFNMLPIGILDGGRFFYLLILSITKSEKKSKTIYKLISSSIGIIFLLLLFGWIIAKFF